VSSNTSSTQARSPNVDTDRTAEHGSSAKAALSPSANTLTSGHVPDVIDPSGGPVKTVGTYSTSCS